MSTQSRAGNPPSRNERPGFPVGPRCVGLWAGAVMLGVVAFLAGCGQGGDRGEAVPAVSPLGASVAAARVVRAFPHDPSAYTQGLLFHGGRLYESTGLYGESFVREVDLATGMPLRNRALPDDLFGEGLALWDDRLIQLTWRAGVARVYDLKTLQPAGEFRYEGEGWGLTHDGARLIMSDGTPVLRFLDPETLERLGTLQVTDAGRPVHRLNELEYVRGEIYANVWGSDRIARISPETGHLLAWIDCALLFPADARTDPADVLNGIAHDPAADRLFVTGKRWPNVFEIEIQSKQPDPASRSESSSQR